MRNNKKLVIIGIILNIVAVAVIALWIFYDVDTSWKRSLDAAFEQVKKSSDADWSAERYQVKSSIDEIYYSDAAYWLYESGNGELCVVGFETKGNKYKYDFFVSCGKPDGLFENQANPADGAWGVSVGRLNIWGVRPHDGKTPYVNGERAQIYSTYDVIFNNATYQIDWWEVLNIGDLVNGEINVEFR